MLMFLLTLLACSDGKTGADTGNLDTDTAQDTDTDTDSADPTCDDVNEECAPGVSGCGGEGANMLPGSNCLECHTRGGDREAPIWSAGGTLFSDIFGSAKVSGATVRITDSTGSTVELTTSSKGNFYTSRSLTPPLSVSVETDAGTVAMAQTVNTGACNSCHRCDGEAGGKLYEP